MNQQFRHDTLHHHYPPLLTRVTSAMCLTLDWHIQHAKRCRATDDLLCNDGKAVDVSSESAFPPQIGISQQLRSRPEQILEINNEN